MATINSSITDFNLQNSWEYYVSNPETDDYHIYKLSSSPSQVTHSTSFTIDGLDLATMDISSAVITWTNTTSSSSSTSGGRPTSGYGSSHCTVEVGDLSTKANNGTLNVLSEVKKLTTNNLPIKFKYKASVPSTYSEEQYDGHPYGVGKCTANLYFKNITLVITYTTKYQQLGTPAITNTATITLRADNGSTSISWSTSTATGANKVKHYEIYKDGSSIGTTTTTSYTISGSNLPAAGSSSNYTVRAISDESGYDSSASSAKTIQCYGEPTKMTLKLYTSANSTQADTIYIGPSSGPTIYAVWTGGAAGKWDSISSISFNGGADNRTGGTNFVAPTSTTTYYVVATMGSGQTVSASATVTVISGSWSSKSFTSQPSANQIVGSNPSFAWNAYNPSNSSYGSVQYTIKLNNSSTLTTQAERSYSFNISSIANDASAYLTISPVITATWGGYVYGDSLTSNTFKRAPSFSISGGTISILGDVASETAKQTYGWTKFNISLSHSQAKALTIIATINGSNTTIYDSSISGSYTGNHIISGYSEGSLLRYTVTIADAYGQTSQQVYERYRFQRPTVVINSIVPSINATSKTASATVSHRITPSSHSTGSTIKYRIAIGYGAESKIVIDNATSVQELESSSISNIHTILKDGSFPTLLGQLTGYNAIANPRLEFTLAAWDTAIGESASIATSSSQNFNFAVAPTGTISRSGASYSSNETAEITYSGSFTDFFGGTNSAKLFYTLKRDGSSVVSEATSNGKYRETYGLISQDATKTYSLVVRQQYSDGISVESNTVSTTIKTLRHLAPTLNVNSIIWSTTTSGKIEFNGKCQVNGATSSDNISSISIVVKIDGSNAENGSVNYNPAPNSSYNLATIFNNVTSLPSSNHEITIVATTTSTGGKTLTSTYGPIVLRAEGIPFAIRKHGIGTNISENFAPTTSDAALQVITNSQAKTAASFVSGAASSTQVDLKFELSSLEGQFAFINDNGEPCFTIIFPD